MSHRKAHEWVKRFRGWRMRVDAPSGRPSIVACDAHGHRCCGFEYLSGCTSVSTFLVFSFQGRSSTACLNSIYKTCT